MNVPAYADNGVVIKDDGNQVVFRPRCPKCGYIPPNVSMTGVVMPHGNAMVGSTSCLKCTNSFMITLYRG